MKATVLLAVLIGMTSCIFAQSGEIRGKVFDELGEPLYSANVSIIGGNYNSGTSTDFDGMFIIKPLDPGVYTVEVSFMGYETVNILEVTVFSSKITFVKNVHMEPSQNMLTGIVYTEHIVELINIDQPQKIIIDSKTLAKSPGSKNPMDLAKRYQSDVQVENNQMIVRGSRPGSSSVFVDGVKVRNESSSVPSMIVGSLEIYTGGIPAKYGDVTGGVVIINTKSYFDFLNERGIRN